MSDNPYLDAYRAALAHQVEHDRAHSRLWSDQPHEYCYTCLRDSNYRLKTGGGRRDIKRQYSWAVPNDAALDEIAKRSPNGVVEIGAGGGYWARMLRSRGVDVIAYDPDPVTGQDGQDGRKRWSTVSWSEVLLGDHNAAARHPNRTLLLVWPSYDDPWTDQVLDLYGGDTVIYVGEGSGGCTGTGRMHRLLGDEPYCWHDDNGDDGCTCGDRTEPPQFEPVAEVSIPQWAGLHDSLYVYSRIAGAS